MSRSAIVEAASELFAERGFPGTTVADIQTAAGLTPGSGALYKHFGSKEELFATCVEAALADIDRTSDAAAAALTSDDLSTTLRMLVVAGLGHMDRQRPLIRLLFQDGHRFPDLRDAFRDQGVRPTYDGFAAWLGAEAKRGRIRAVDAKAVAAILVGSVVAYRFTHELIGEPPARIAKARFIDAWVELALTALAPR